MRKARLVAGFVLFLLLAGSIVPLYIACVILASETPMSHEQYVRMCGARDSLLWVCLALPFAAGWLIYTGFGINKTPATKLLCIAGLSAGLLLCSSLAGFVASNLTEHAWYRLAWRLFG
jgi:hypothetical protein